jgi:serine/threonine-protein kinase HipA
VTSVAIPAVRHVRAADVRKQGHRVATLVRAPDAVEFAYLPEHVAAGGPAVATSLPVSATPVRTTAGAVPAFFAGLLPEGRRLTSLRRAVKTSADDELSLLLAVGRDTVGDVQVVPAGEPADAPEPLVTVRREWREVRFADLLADAGIVDPVALAGVQDKVSARVLSLPVARAHERYLLKLEPPEFPHLVANEAFFLALAREARLPCVTAEVVHDADGRAGLLVKRFDRVAGPARSVAALACEDGCQVLGRWPADKYALTTEEVVRGLARRCSAEVAAVRALFGQVCFAWLTGNGDLHAKNMSILEDPGGEWQIAPAYDLPATVPYGDGTLALSVQGRTRGLSRKHLLAFAADVGLPRAAAVAVLDDVLARTSDLEARLRAGALPFPQKTLADWSAEIRNRRRHAAA